MGERARWYLYAAGSGRAVGYNWARNRDGDFAFGGAGRDVMIANTALDRMYDWGGEFNSFLVPFSTVASYSFSIVPLFVIMGFLVFHAGFAAGCEARLCLAARAVFPI